MNEIPRILNRAQENVANKKVNDDPWRPAGVESQDIGLENHLLTKRYNDMEIIVWSAMMPIRV